MMDAATLAVVQNNKLPQPPAIVWRVKHAGNEDALWCARLATARFGDDDDFRYTKSQHYKPKNRKPTPFLSTFSSEHDADSWVRENLNLNQGAVCIYSIDTNGLDMFSTPRGHEFLIWGQIPRDNILSERQLSWRDNGGARRGRQKHNRARGGRRMVRYKRADGQSYGSGDEDAD